MRLGPAHTGRARAMWWAGVRAAACRAGWPAGLARRAVPGRGMARLARLPLSVAETPGDELVFSGIQATGVPHLGNYIGALRQWVTMQEEYPGRCLFSVMDLHSITVPQDPEQLRKNIRDTAITLLACGLDPDKCTIFQQSRVRQHAELTWALGTITHTGNLLRMTQWKSKTEPGPHLDKRSPLKVKPATPALGLFAYPVLMAADILLYQATLVPVGEDQLQHIELTRDVAGSFNERFGQCFTMPAPIVGKAPRVMSLRSPLEKMSKSARSVNGRIAFSDPPAYIQLKIKKAVTDRTGDVIYHKTDRPGVSNLIQIYAALAHESIQDVELRFAGLKTDVFKKDLGRLISHALIPIQAEMKRLKADPGYVDQVLEDGAAKASERAEQTLDRVYSAMGLR